MSANIEFNTQKETYSFYSLKVRPWHDLGRIVDEALTPDEVVKSANLDYQVQLAPIRAHIDNGWITPEIANTFATYRTDNNHVLGVVGKRYEVVQNAAAVDFIYNVCKSGVVYQPDDVIIETAGVLGSGERIFMTAKLPGFNILNDSSVDSYILFTNSFDGSGAVEALFTNTRVVCNNTLNIALRNAGSKNRISIRHTRNVHEQLKKAAIIMNGKYTYDQMQKEKLEQFSAIPVQDATIDSVIGNVMFSPEGTIEMQRMGGLNKAVASEVLSARSLNQAVNIRHYVESGVGQDQSRGSLLWLFNGFTGYFQNGKQYKTQKDKYDSVFNGDASRKVQAAFDACLSLANGTGRPMITSGNDKLLATA
jgi:phage/plasmid-like protein (TIGR03299 family)